MAQQGFEFTPEIDEEFLRRLRSGIERRGQRSVGLARSEALSRGLEGDPFESSAVGSARETTERAIGDLEADFGFRRAGLQREERLLGEERKFGAEQAQIGRDFSASEAQKDRELRRVLSSFSRRDRDDDFLNSLIGGFSSAFGGALGRRF